MGAASRGPHGAWRSRFEREINCTDDQRVGNETVPFEGRSEKEPSDKTENHEGDALLHDLQLRDGEVIGPDAIRRAHLDTASNFETKGRPNRNCGGLFLEPVSRSTPPDSKIDHTA